MANYVNYKRKAQPHKIYLTDNVLTKQQRKEQKIICHI